MVGTPRVLVAYATAAGSTAGVAERVAAVLRTAGCEVVCRPADPDVDLDGFDGLVLGSAVHNTAWLPSALDVLRRAASQGMPVWCFSVGGVNPRSPFTRYVARREIEQIARQFPAGFTARDHRLFAGIVATKGVPLWGRLFYRITGARPGDHRDWPVVEGWAKTVAAALTRATASEQTP